MVDGSKKKDDDSDDYNEAKKFDLRKKDSASSKKPWHENVEMEKQMEDEKNKKENPQKLYRVVHEHQAAMKEKAVGSAIFHYNVQTLVFADAFCNPFTLLHVINNKERKQKNYSKGGLDSFICIKLLLEVFLKKFYLLLITLFKFIFFRTMGFGVIGIHPQP